MDRLWRVSWVLRGRTLLSLVALGGLVMLTLACGSNDGGVSVRQSDATSTPSETPLAGATPGADGGSATETATPEPTIYSIEDLVSNYGYPEGYDYAHLRIPKIGVDAPVGLAIVDTDQMGAPQDPATVYVYDFRAWPDLGGLPGQGKNAVFSGHVDLSAYVPYAGVTYHGLGVFSNLHLLGPGDIIFVDVNGITLQYMVTWVDQLGAEDGARWAEILSADVPVESITLYTCGGDFDSVGRTYADRVVVRAELQ